MKKLYIILMLTGAILIILGILTPILLPVFLYEISGFSYILLTSVPIFILALIVFALAEIINVLNNINDKLRK